MLELLSEMSIMSLILFYLFIVVSLAIMAVITAGFVISRMSAKLDMAVAGITAVLESMVGVEHRCPLADGGPDKHARDVASSLRGDKLSVKVRPTKRDRGLELTDDEKEVWIETGQE